MNARSVLALLVALPACLIKPSAPDRGTSDGGVVDAPPSEAGAGSDAGSDEPTPMVPRVIANAYWYSPNDNATGAGSTDMTMIGYSIPTAGIRNGDVVLLIANIDKGDDNVFGLPTSSFSVLFESRFGTDGQTYFGAYTIANDEPATYRGTYDNFGGSSAVAMTLIAISGADTSGSGKTINHIATYEGTTIGASPAAQVTSSADETTTPNCAILVAAGADWEKPDGAVAEAYPSAFHFLTKVTDKGDAPGQTNMRWSSQGIAWFQQAAADQPIGDQSIMLNSNGGSGQPWGAMIAIAPAS